jgi:aminopeptidase 2
VIHLIIYFCLSDLAEPINYRLPTNLSPYLYELSLKPYVGPKEIYGDKAFTFEGFQKIHFTCKTPTNRIVLNSLELDLNSESLSLNSETDQSGIRVLKRIEYDQVRQFAMFDMSRDCQKGANYTLSIRYTGKILDVLYGFYKSSYKDSKGNTN